VPDEPDEPNAKPNGHATANGNGNGLTANGGAPRRIACTFFLRGLCNRGDACPFVHARDAERPLCRYVGEPGGCKFGSRCMFRHESVGGESAAAELRAQAQTALASLKTCADFDETGTRL
jgi:hypothetical protein